jgi:hypothetical protein
MQVEISFIFAAAHELLTKVYSKVESQVPRVARLAAASTTLTVNCGGGVAYHWLRKRGTNTCHYISATR